MRHALVAVIATVTLVAGGAPATAARPTTPTAGSPGIGDPYFPDYGNGGYDVGHYDIRLRYQPATDQLSGTTTILATAEQDLSSFDLDFALTASSVDVNGWPAAYRREGGHELVVTPARTLSRGQAMTVVVRYAGVPSTVSVNGLTAWTRTGDGALAVGEPEVAWWWFPSNDHPLDKATFDVSVAVPDSVTVVSNGTMAQPPWEHLIGWTRWYWRNTRPTATYLAFLAIGDYDLSTDVTPGGVPLLYAYDRHLGDETPAAQASIGRTAEVLDWETSLFGPYPFDAAGGVAAPPDSLGFSEETQTRPVYGPGAWQSGSNMYVVVHELAHQWFGDSVSVASWRDIWLNEGFASYAEWLWSEAHGEGTAQEIFDFYHDEFYPPDSDFWQVLPGDPGPADLFAYAIYDRGAMTLHQLRLAVGDTDFFRILGRWASGHAYGNGTTEQFISLAESVSGLDLGQLFTTWLFTPGRPTVASPSTVARRTAVPTSWPKLRAAEQGFVHLGK
jgi:aminopeptidase N